MRTATIGGFVLVFRGDSDHWDLTGSRQVSPWRTKSGLDWVCEDDCGTLDRRLFGEQQLQFLFETCKSFCSLRFVSCFAALLRVFMVSLFGRKGGRYPLAV